MTQTSRRKLKILYLYKMLQEETDAQHGLSMPQIIERLAEYGIEAERKSVYEDLKTLREFDVPVKKYDRRPSEYGLERRDFSLGELTLIVDAIQSSRAITNKQARVLVTNIKTLATTREQEKLDRHIHVVGRIKSINESVLGAVDAAHEAIRKRCKLAFIYNKLGPDGKRYGKKHLVTPIAIAYDDGFYYLTAWDEERQSRTEFRLDRMGAVQVLDSEPATKNQEIRSFCYNEQNVANFGRFMQDEMVATLVVPADKQEIVSDRFGSAILSSEMRDGYVEVRVRVYKSKQFFGWIAGLDKLVRIVQPQSLVQEYKDYLRSLLDD